MEVSEQPQEQPQEQQPRRVPPPGSKIRRGFIRLRREENCIQWGFRIIGGSDLGEPLQILKVSKHVFLLFFFLHCGYAHLLIELFELWYPI